MRSLNEVGWKRQDAISASMRRQLDNERKQWSNHEEEWRLREHQWGRKETKLDGMVEELRAAIMSMTIQFNKERETMEAEIAKKQAPVVAAWEEAVTTKCKNIS